MMLLMLEAHCPIKDQSLGALHLQVILVLVVEGVLCPYKHFLFSQLGGSATKVLDSLVPGAIKRYI